MEQVQFGLLSTKVAPKKYMWAFKVRGFCPHRKILPRFETAWPTEKLYLYYNLHPFSTQPTCTTAHSKLQEKKKQLCQCHTPFLYTNSQGCHAYYCCTDWRAYQQALSYWRWENPRQQQNLVPPIPEPASNSPPSARSCWLNFTGSYKPVHL